MYQKIITFWFEEIDASFWWKKDSNFDVLMRSRFLKIHNQAVRGELFPWRESALGSLAEVIVLDQFSRNIYRDQPASFTHDGMALVLAQSAIAKGYDKQLNDQQKRFLYMPFMHSESLLIHEQAVELFTCSGLQSSLEFEIKHKAIIERFGRYPHRNSILGRASTEEEIAFLQQPGSSF